MDLKIASIQSQDEQKLKSLLIKHHDTMSEIKEMKAELDKHLLSGERSSLFIASQKALKDIVSIQRTLKQIDDNKTIIKCVFEPGTKLTQTLNKMDTLGIISILGHEREVVTTFKISFNVTAANDTSRSNLTGLKILSDQSTLVVADNKNKNVILIDSANKRIIGHVKLDAGPWDVTEMTNSSAKEVAVTIPDLGKIQFLVLEGSGPINKGKQIKVGTWCRGIASCGLGFVISYSNICRLEIIDTKGKILKTISTDLNGDLLFKAPDYVLINPLRNTIYVSDRIKNSVYCFSENGDVVRSFVGQSANSLALDRFGNVIMCSTIGDLRMLPPDLNTTCLPVSLSGSIQRVSNKKSSWPQSCFFDCSNNCLYVSWKNDP